MAYQEIRFWCPFRDAHMTRISMFDSRGGEFFQVVPTAPGGRARREVRYRAVAEIEMAIKHGCEPGEVVVEEVADE